MASVSKEVTAVKEILPNEQVSEIIEEPNTSSAPQIAELAYYKAESRGFVPGYELIDWLEAEQELSPR